MGEGTIDHPAYAATVVLLVVASLAVGWTGWAVATGGPQLTFDGNGTSVTRGDALAYQVEGSTDGAVHVVSMAALDLRQRPAGPTDVANATAVFEGTAGVGSGVLLDNGTAVLVDGRVFRDGGVVRSGAAAVDGETIEEVFTLLEMDSEGVGGGELNTSRLAAVSVDLNLFAGAPNATAAVGAYEAADGDGSIHQRSIRVAEDEASLTITSPSESYVLGDRIVVEGEVEGSVDAVAVYVSDGDDWQLVEPSLANVSVEDGTYRRTGVHLFDEAPLLRVPGTYSIGVVPVEEADLDGDGRADRRLTREAFARRPFVESQLEVLEPRLTGGIETYGGEVAAEDGTYNVSGWARGASEVAVVFVDSQGETVVKREPVDESWVYSEAEFSLTDRDGELQEGSVVGLVLASGPDRVFGRPGDPPDSIHELVEFVDELERRRLTQSQVVALLLESTVMDRGSDDLGNRTEFRYAGADLDVRSVGSTDDGNATAGSQLEPGTSVEVQGSTNLRPDTNVVELELVERPRGRTVAEATAEEWDRDGNWTATIDVPDNATPGRYLLRVDAGVVSVPVPVEVVGQPAGTTEDGTTAEEETTTEETTTDSETTTTTEETTTTTTAETTAATTENTTTVEAASANETTTAADRTPVEQAGVAADASPGNASEGALFDPDITLSPGQAGFGAGLAALALAVAALVASRRL